MAQFGGYLAAGRAVGFAFPGGHVRPFFAARKRAGLAGQGDITVLGIGMPEPVRVAEVGLVGLVLEPLQVLHIRQLRRDK